MTRFYSTSAGAILLHAVLERPVRVPIDLDPRIVRRSRMTRNFRHSVEDAMVILAGVRVACLAAWRLARPHPAKRDRGGRGVTSPTEQWARQPSSSHFETSVFYRSARTANGHDLAPPMSACPRFPWGQDDKTSQHCDESSRRSVLISIRRPPSPLRLLAR